MYVGDGVGQWTKWFLFNKAFLPRLLGGKVSLHFVTACVILRSDSCFQNYTATSSFRQKYTFCGQWADVSTCVQDRNWKVSCSRSNFTRLIRYGDKMLRRKGALVWTLQRYYDFVSVMQWGEQDNYSKTVTQSVLCRTFFVASTGLTSAEANDR